MKRKKFYPFILLLATMLISLNLAAQENQSLNTSSENQALQKSGNENKNDFWFISAGGGLSLVSSEMDREKSSTAFRFGGEISAGKWIHPYFGTRIQFLAGEVRAYDLCDWQSGYYVQKDGSLSRYPIGPAKDFKIVDNGKFYEKDFNYVSLSADFMLNLLGLIKQKQERLDFNVIPFVGIGWMHSSETCMKPVFNGISGKLGVRLDYSFAPKWSVYLEPQTNFINEKFDGYIGGERKFELESNLLLGIQFKLN